MSDTEQTAGEDKQEENPKADNHTAEEDANKDDQRTHHNDDVHKTNASKNKEKQYKNKPKENDKEKDGDQSKQEFIKEELNRLETSLKREYSKVQPPLKKPYTPYIFNSLEPYYNTRMARFLIHMPDEQFHSFRSRSTAQSLIDPWVDLKMSTELPPLISPRQANQNEAHSKTGKENNKKTSQKPPGDQKPTKFPVIKIETKDLDNKPLYYSDVPALRELLKSKYSANAQARIEDDRNRTTQEFYKMELDRLDKVHPVNRKHMMSVYCAYLQNTPGSKMALSQCLEQLQVE